MHRADQIIDAIVSAVAGQVSDTGVHVFAHRRLLLEVEQDELPAISVDFGQDERAETVIIGKLGSLLTVETTAVVARPDETEAKQELLNLRAEIHKAIMSAPRLGMPAFVVDTLYAGANPPEYDTEGDLIVGTYTSLWQVYYTMNSADPT